MATIKILHLEDASFDADLINYALKKSALEFETKIVADKEGFETCLHHFQPDIILSDHALPSFDSFHALALAQKEIPQIPFILVTGTMSEEFAVKVMKAGASDYILKDRLERLPQAITQALENHRLQKQSAQYLQKIIDHEKILRKTEHMAHVGSFRSDLKTNTTVWSDEVFHLVGITPDDGKASFSFFKSFIHPEDQEFVEKIVNWAITDKRPVNFNYRIIDSDNKIKYLTAELSIEYDEHEQATHLTGFTQDVTKLETAMETIKNSEANLYAIINSTKDFIWSVNKRFEIVYANTPYCDLVQLQLNRSIKSGDMAPYEIFCKDEQILNKHYTKALNGNSFIMAFSISRAGANTYYEISFNPIYQNNKVFGASCFARDITREHEMEEEIKKEKNATQKKIAQAIIAAEQRERTRIAGELHDNVNQILTSAKLYVSLLKKEALSPHPFYDKVEELILTSIQENRRLSQSLTSYILIEFGLVKAIEELVDWAKKAGLQSVEVDVAALQTHQLSDNLKTNLYRIIQEVFTNTIKYANATKIQLTITMNCDEITVTISDNGSGFNPSSKSKGIGLMNIKNRALLFDGDASFISAPGIGSTVVVRLKTTASQA